MIYLDNAATTLRKPIEVANAMSNAVNQFSSPGRGGYRPSAKAGECVFQCREAVADLFHMDNIEGVVFTSSATHSLNIAIRSLVHEGDTVLISGWEHNAVTRTLKNIPNVKIRIATSPLFDQASTYASFSSEITRDVKVVIFTHMSNVFGYILPIQKLAVLCRTQGIPFIIDASQSAGSLPIDAERLGADYIAMPGHKGLLGPQGTGLLLCQSCPEPLLTGGTGSESILQEMPSFLPDRVEAGTHNVPGIAGLLEGIRYIQTIGLDNILIHERMVLRRLVHWLREQDGITAFVAENPSVQGGVLSLVVDGYDCEELGERLGELGICVRAGLHCAPLAHLSAGTLESGTLRVSLSPFTTMQEIDKFINILVELIENKQ